MQHGSTATADAAATAAAAEAGETADWLVAGRCRQHSAAAAAATAASRAAAAAHASAVPAPATQSQTRNCPRTLESAVWRCYEPLQPKQTTHQTPVKQQDSRERKGRVSDLRSTSRGFDFR